VTTIDLSIVSPCYNEHANLPRLHAELTRVLSAMDISYEIILVENGSADESMPFLAELAASDSHVKIVQLSRNFTYQGGIAAGMEHASGERLITIDADLQDPVDLIPELYRVSIEDEYDIVYGVRRSRKEGMLRQVGYRMFYRVMRAITPFDVPLDAGDFALVTRRVLNVLRALPERDRFLRGLRAWTGFRSTGVPYDRQARKAGESKFPFSAMILLAFRGLFSFSFMPIRLLFTLGVAILALVIPLIIGYAVWRIVEPSAWPPGIATLVILLFTQIGLTMLGIGLIGEYLSIIFIEVKNRPTYVVRSLINLEEQEVEGRDDERRPRP
jgi:polyisoprenyl-phosphate glycosyltransferase